MRLRWPDLEHVPEYADALRRGWSPTTQDDSTTERHLAEIDRDPSGFVRSLVDREAQGVVTLPDGSTAERLPGYRKWMWDDGFCGSISLRWRPGSPELPPHVLGHIGYHVVPWRRRRGYATKALGLILIDAADEGLPYVEVTTSTDNEASQRVITANGGRLVEEFVTPESHSSRLSLRYRIDL